jgi:hypothetical protein
MEKQAEKEPSEIEIKQSFEGISLDWYLQHLVKLANDTGLEFGITLSVGGSVVSGTLISGRKYFDKFASEFSASWPGQDKEEIKSSISKIGAIYDKPDNEEDRLVNPPPQFIHLANARIFHGREMLPSSVGVLWRGKLNAVSGFSLGSLSTT